MWPQLREIDSVTAESLQTDARYAVYLDRQRVESEMIRMEEGREISLDFDFSDLAGLSNELKHKLALRRPRSIADAQRVEGMTPAALAIIIASMKHGSKVSSLA